MSETIYVLFDFDGVIADSESLHFQGFVQVATDLGYRLTRAHYDEAMIGFDDVDGVRYLLEQVGQNPGEQAQQIEPLCQIKEQYVADHLAEVPLMPHAATVYQQTLEHHPTAIVSGALRSEIEQILDAHKLPRPKVIVAAGETKHGKPSPEPYLKGKTLLGVNDDDVCWVAEDTYFGARAALDAGCNVVHLAAKPDQKLAEAAQTREVKYQHRNGFALPWLWTALMLYAMLWGTAAFADAVRVDAGNLRLHIASSQIPGNASEPSIIDIDRATGVMQPQLELEASGVRGAIGQTEKGPAKLTFESEQAQVSHRKIIFPIAVRGTIDADNSGQWWAASGQWDGQQLLLNQPALDTPSYSVAARYGTIHKAHNSAGAEVPGFFVALTDQVRFETR